MLHQQNRYPSRVQFDDHPKNFFDQQRCQSHRRFVQQQQARSAQHGPADGQHLLLATGQRTGQLLPTFGKNRKQSIYPLHFLSNPILIAPLAKSAQPQIVLDAQRREDQAAFRNLADTGGNDAVRRPPGDILAGETDATTAGGMETREGVEQGRFARAIAADDGDQFAGTNMQIGLMKRVEIARALATRPRLLLLDEPAAGLNDTESLALRDLIERIRASGVTVLLVEHHMPLVMNVSNRLLVLDYGSVLAEGTPDEIKADQRVAAAYLGGAVQYAV